MKDEQTTQPSAPEVHEEIQAQRFTLVDEAGRTRAHLTAAGNETVLAMYDQRGGLRLAIHASDRETVLNIFDKYDGADKDRRGDTLELIRLGYEINTKGERPPGLHIFDEGEDERLTLRVNNEGGVIFATAPSGHYAALDGDGLTVLDENDNALAECYAPSEELAPLPAAQSSPAATEPARQRKVMSNRKLARHFSARRGSVKKCPRFQIPKATCPPLWNISVLTEADFYAHCKTAGIRVYADRKIKQKGLAMGYKGIPRIFISVKLTGLYRQFVELHELGHALLHLNYAHIRRTRRQRRLQEIQANVFAVCGLIPRPLLDQQTPAQIVAEYGYPKGLVEFRREIAKRWDI